MNARFFRLLFGTTFALAIAWALVNVPLPAPVRAAPTTTFTVTSNSDAADATINGICDTGGGVCTLRAAIQEADATSGAIINFGLGGSISYLLTLGELNITSNMTIVGNGSGNTIIDGDANSRVFDISSPSLLVSISNVTIQNGRTNQGAGIYNTGQLSLTNSIVMSNTANTGADPKDGGGIYNTGALTITNSFINHNSAPAVNFSGGGGGIHNYGGSVLLKNSTLDSNSTNFLGGAIQVDSGTVSLVDSTVNSNIAVYGGGIYNGGLSGSGTLNITRSGIFSNTATNSSFPGGGGGINNHAGVATVLNSTIYLNVANRDGGGIYNDDGFGGTTRLYNVTLSGNFADWDADGVGTGGGITGSVTLRNTILAGNYKYASLFQFWVHDDCKGTINSEDFNLIQTTTGCSISGATGNNKTGLDPQFSYPISYNGGPTLNLALLPTSPALDSGNTGGCRDVLGALIPTDQRGWARPYPAGGRCDIGAYELGASLFLPLIRR